MEFSSIRNSCLGVVATLVVATAHAALINFDSHPATGLVAGTPPASTVVTNVFAPLGVVFGRAGVSAGTAVINNSSAFSQPNGACGLDVAGDIVDACTGNQHFFFVDPGNGTTPAVTNSLSFVVGDTGGDLDSWILHVFDINNVELEARVVASDANILQSFGFAGMHRVFIEWTNGSAGYLLDNLEFNTPQPAVNGSVPEPAAIALFGFGLAGIGIALRRRRRA